MSFHSVILLIFSAEITSDFDSGFTHDTLEVTVKQFRQKCNKVCAKKGHEGPGGEHLGTRWWPSAALPPGKGTGVDSIEGC